MCSYTLSRKKRNVIYCLALREAFQTTIIEFLHGHCNITAAMAAVVVLVFWQKHYGLLFKDLAVVWVEI